MSEAYEETAYEELPPLTNEAKNWAVLCHLSGFFGFGVPVLGHALGPLIVWLLKRNDHPFIDAVGKEAVNFQISVTIYSLGLACTFVGIPLIFVLWVVDMVLMVLAAIKASEGVVYRYPFTLKLVN